MDDELNVVKLDGKIIGKVMWASSASWRDDGKLSIGITDGEPWVLDKEQIFGVIRTLQHALVKHGLELPSPPSDELVEFWKKKNDV